MARRHIYPEGQKSIVFIVDLSFVFYTGFYGRKPRIHNLKSTDNFKKVLYSLYAQISAFYKFCWHRT